MLEKSMLLSFDLLVVHAESLVTKEHSQSVQAQGGSTGIVVLFQAFSAQSRAFRGSEPL